MPRAQLRTKAVGVGPKEPGRRQIEEASTSVCFTTDRSHRHLERTLSSARNQHMELCSGARVSRLDRSSSTAVHAMTRFAPTDQEGEACAREVEARLQGSSYLALRSIQCVCRDRVVTLRGCLPTHYHRQLVLQIVTETVGSHATHDEIEVIPPLRREPPGKAVSRGSVASRPSRGN